jgi:molecular chaperone GrpE
MRDLQDAHKYAITNFARELLEVADNLSRALEAVPARARDEIEFVRNLADGIAMTEKALLTSFERHQIEKVMPAIGEKFDHNRHQAMFEVESTEQPPGTVVQVLQPGYTIAERLLRPALVAVAKGAPGRASGAADDGGAHRAGGGEHGPQARPGGRIDASA